MNQMMGLIRHAFLTSVKAVQQLVSSFEGRPPGPRPFRLGIRYGIPSCGWPITGWFAYEGTAPQGLKSTPTRFLSTRLPNNS